MMIERLKLAKKLLSDDGVIFASIDDTEQAYLKILMDEIFGENNFINQLVWVSNKKGRQISNSAFSKTYEYILMYSKSLVKNFENAKIDRKWSSTTMPAIYIPKKDQIETDEIGEFLFQNELHNTNIKAFNINTRKNLYFPIYVKENKISTEFIEGYSEIFPPKNRDGLQGVWRWSKDKVKNEKQDLHVVKKDDQYKIYTKIRESFYTPKDIILSSSFTTKSGGDELNSLGITNFSFPKPSKLIKFLLKMTSKKDAVILDFFGGSGTTGQAVMELNKEDGGNRKFILVTNNENNIGVDITYERLYRIIRGQSTDGKKDFKWLEKNEPYKESKLRVFNIKNYPCSLNDSVKNIEEQARKSFSLIDNQYNEKTELNVYYDLNSLHPYKKESDK